MKCEYIELATHIFQKICAKTKQVTSQSLCCIEGEFVIVTDEPIKKIIEWNIDLDIQKICINQILIQCAKRKYTITIYSTKEWGNYC